MAKKEVIAVLGLGLFGSSLARTLAGNNKEVIAVDTQLDAVEAIADEVSFAVQGDFSKYETLSEAGVGEADIAIIASASHFDTTILSVLNLQRLKVPVIIAKTRKAEYKKVLLKLGVDRVIIPEVDMGIRIANELSDDSVLDLIQLDEESHIVEFTARSQWIGKTISEIDFRTKYHLNLIAMRDRSVEGFDISISPDYVVEKGDLFVGLTSNSEAKKLLEPEEPGRDK